MSKSPSGPREGSSKTLLKSLSVGCVTALACTVFFFAMGGKSSQFGPPVVMGSESIMSPKAHGTCPKPLQENLRYGVSPSEADRVVCFNRHMAERSGSFLRTNFLKDVDRSTETAYYDPCTGKPLFIAPKGRTFEEFLTESRKHGWPSFRDEEVVWENVRILPGGEAVSVDGSHLGHNLPDRNGNRYCINLVSIAGNP